MASLTHMQERILDYLRQNPGWHDRKQMIASGVGENGYSCALGNITLPDVDSLIGRGLVEFRRESSGEPIEYRSIEDAPKL